MNRFGQSRGALGGVSSVEATRKGGAVIIVVLALMAMLAFLGLFFYDFVQVEANTAQNFSQTVDPLAGFDPEGLINDGISQIIVHPSEQAVARGSVLDGGKVGLLSHILGTLKQTGAGVPYKPHDYEFRNGRGIRVIPGTPPRFIYTGNDQTPNPPVGMIGQGSDVPDLVLNRSAAANPPTLPAAAARLPDTDFSYEPDVGYTYPDVTSIFLSADYLQLNDLDNNGEQNGTEELVRVIKPSFMDPAVFLALRNNTSDWYSSNDTKRWIFRPHAFHQIPSTQTRRFLVDEFPKITSTPTTLRFGAWNLPAMPTSDDYRDYSGLDADADADGVFDSIYMDLGLEPVTLADGSGRTLVPMSFWKIEDLSGLIDLNSAGNIADVIYKNRTTGVNLVNDIYFPTPGTERPVHYSHYGLSRAEVNPMWSLWAPPPTSMTPDGRTRWDVGFYRNTANATFSRLQMQNTELAMLLLGSSVSMEQSISGTHNFDDNLDDLQGRYGVSNRILTRPTGQYSAAGLPDSDEDLTEDGNENGMLDTGEDNPTYPNTVLDGYQRPRGIHPTDSFGTGGVQFDLSKRGARALSLLANGKLPLPGYVGRWQSQPTAAMGPNFQTLSGTPLLPPINGMDPPMVDLRRDDPAEVNRYSYMNQDLDNPFRPSEIAALHLSDFDFTRLAMFSRVRQLAPFNFNMSAYSRDIRRQFTTESWDRREFSFAYDPNRDFEFNDVDGSHFRFPPMFAGGVSRHETTPPTIMDLDPFRPEVRRLLTTFSIRSGTVPVRNRAYFPQLPLELNRILDDRDAEGFPAFDDLGNPNFRMLTPHPNLRLAPGTGTVEPTMVHGNNPASFPTMTTTMPPTAHPIQQFNTRLSDPYIQEWWARYDRQRVARDIYVLLATLCTPNTTGNVTNTDLETLSPGMAREFAQFAVNYVDAFDEDDCITRFEYDTNLVDGWNPDGSLYVNGLEAQKLSISEVAWIKQKKNMGTINGTFHKDSVGHHEFMFIELRNSSPLQIDLREQTWRIVRIDPKQLSATMDPTLTMNHLASFAFRSTTKFVQPGANFVIAGHDGNVVNESNAPISSDYYADTDGDNTTLEAVLPVAGSTPITPIANTAVPDPLCDFDLCHTRDAMEFTMLPLGDPANSVYSATMRTATNGVPKLLYFDANNEDLDPDANHMILSLQRRRHLYTDGKVTNQLDSDWIEVDRLDFSINAGNVLDIASEGDQITDLPNVRSQERYHPLDDRDDQAVQATRLYLANHSIYQAYGATPATQGDACNWNTIATEDPANVMTNAYMRLWQPHHDRELTSAYELMTIPLVGPTAFLSRFRDHGLSVNAEGGVNGWSNSSTFLPYAASVRFTPRYEDPQPATAIPWTRLLNFVTLPDPTDRVQRKLNPNFIRSRTFGQVNINTLRSPTVLEGLLDDPWTIQANTAGLKNVATLPTARFLWNDFKTRRDGSAANGMGGLNSVPFLPPGQFNRDPSRPADAVERGLARHREILNGSNPKFGLFEARDPSDVDATTDHAVVDLYSRNRLLQKLANNTSNRSHMFAIWGGIDFFEGTASGTGFQVGAKAPDLQTCRWFFVVDMSRLEEAYVSSNQTFDWRKFVIYRQRLE